MKMKNTIPLLGGLVVLAAVISFGLAFMEHPVGGDAGLLARAKWEMRDGEFDPDGFRIAAKAEQGDYCLIWFFAAQRVQISMCRWNLKLPEMTDTDLSAGGCR